MDGGFRARVKIKEECPGVRGDGMGGIVLRTARGFRHYHFFVTTISERYCVVIDLCLNKLLYLSFYKPIS